MRQAKYRIVKMESGDFWVQKKYSCCFSFLLRWYSIKGPFSSRKEACSNLYKRIKLDVQLEKERTIESIVDCV